MVDRIYLKYTILVDGYIPNPDGELSIEKTDWDKHKQYHLAIGGFFIDCNATGGESDIAKQMLSSKGIQWTLSRADSAD
jgi:hypothetical protein